MEYFKTAALSVVPDALASSGNLLKTYSQAHPDLLNQKLWEQGSVILCFNKLTGGVRTPGSEGALSGRD